MLGDHGTHFEDTPMRPAQRHYTFTIKLDGPITESDVQSLARTLEREEVPADASIQFGHDRIYAYWVRPVPPV